MRAIVTGGGTSEPIDDVRVITNISKGSFALEIARALTAQGVNVLLIGNKNLEEKIKLGGDRFHFLPFQTFDEFREVLFDSIELFKPHMLFMAAAVSDYRPIRSEGKLSSNSDELTIRCVKNPKLIAELRERCGESAFLVGFKLLSNVTQVELINAATAQNKRYGLDLTVANDLKDLVKDYHPIKVVTQAGGAIPIDGLRQEVAAELATLSISAATSVLKAAPGIRSTQLDEHLRAQNTSLLVATESSAERHYLTLGYSRGTLVGELRTLCSPISIQSLTKSATVAILNRITKKVLLGLRLVGPWPSIYAFPGGKVEPGESRLDCMKRELKEETGIDFDNIEARLIGEPHQEYVSNGEVVFDINVFVAETTTDIPPIRTEEIEGVWVPFDEVFSLPLGPGTRRLLEKILPKSLN